MENEKAPIMGAFSLHSVRRYAKVKTKTATLHGDGFLTKTKTTMANRLSQCHFYL